MMMYRVAKGRFPVLPLDREHGIDFVGGGGTFTSISAESVLDGRALENDPFLFRNRIVLIGVTLTEAKEMFATPVAKAGNDLCPGVEVHANVLASMIDESYIATVSRGPQILLAVIITAVAGLLAMFQSLRMVILFYALMILAVIASAIALFVYQGLSIDITYPILALALGYILAGLPARQPMVLHTRVGPYELLEELGRGGMAVVYRARHPRTREIVALKQMLPQYAADDKALQRFLREMDLLRELNHPNIVRIVDAGDLQGQPYYAMEYIPGKSLDDVLNEQLGLSPQELRRICEGVARALYQAHELGVVHRDIKPSNIMLTGTGTPKLTDFGIACKTDAPHLTQAGMLIGTPQYMSPEQCRGLEITLKSDIYSFGATMYHLLAGAPPFPWPDINRVTRSHIEDTPVDIRQKNQLVDEALAHLVMTSLAKDPAERPASMLDVARALDPYAMPTAIDLPAPHLDTGSQTTIRGTAIMPEAEPSRPMTAPDTPTRHDPPTLPPPS